MVDKGLYDISWITCNMNCDKGKVARSMLYNCQILNVILYLCSTLL